MKKWISIILMAILTLCLVAACSGKESDGDLSKDKKQKQTSSSLKEESETYKETEVKKTAEELFIESLDVDTLENNMSCPICKDQLWIGKGGFTDPETGEVLSENDLFCKNYDFILSYTFKNKQKVIYYVNWLDNGQEKEFGTDYAGYWRNDIDSNRK